MDSLDSIKDRFSHDYNEAIDNYNNGDVVLFFRNIRPAIEAFCKLVIFDLAGPQLAEELLSGQQFLDCNYKECTATLGNGTTHSIENSMLATLALKTIYYTKGDTLALYKEHRKVDRIKRSIDADFNKLVSDYKSTSETGMHDGDSSIDKEIEAKSLSAFMPKVFSDLRSILSNDTMAFLATLKKPLSNVVFQNPMAEQNIVINNDLLVFDELTNRLEQSSDINYVVLLPQVLKDSVGNQINKEQLKDFFKIHWNFILDLDPKSENGLYENAPSEVKSSRHTITSFSDVSGSSNLTNWLLGKGREDLSVFDDKKVVRDTPKLFADTFSKIVRTGKTNDYIIIDFLDSFPKLSRRIFEKLEVVFGTWESVSNRCTIISFTQNNEYKDAVNSWLDGFDIPVHFVSATFGDFINHIVELRPNASTPRVNGFFIHNNKLDIAESKERYKAAGIEFFGPPLSSNSEREVIWDFYSGAEITWDELDNQYDVTRDKYGSVKSRVTEIIRTTRRTSIYTLRHRPGSGATTLARRLAYDIRKEDENGGLSCTVIEIKNCSNIRLTEQYLCLLSEQIENSAILAVVESKHVGREKFDYLVKRISNVGKNVLFFYVEPFTASWTSGKKDNVAFLESTLTPHELQKFNDKYFSKGLDKVVLDNAKKRNKDLEVVDYPLMLKDKETSDNLSTYVNEWMIELPDNLRKFCAYVAFVFKYSNLGINQTILKSIWKDEFHLTVRSYTAEEKNAISKLLIEEMTEDGTPTGVWRPRYNRFSDFILASYKNNWKAALSDMAKDFIALCKDAGELGSDDKDMLYSVFIMRKEADYRAVEDNKTDIRNKFSLLINDLNDNERAESLFEVLFRAFPEDPVILGHYSRFLYEKAHTLKDIDIHDRLFIDAQNKLDLAFGLSPRDADLHHMQGMLIRRRIGALSKMYDRAIHDNKEEINIEDFEDTLHEWTQQASESFELSIEYSPASPYGYAAESQLFKESITLGQKLLGLGNNDFSFCETYSVYADYTEKLGDVLDLFEQVCYSFINEGLSQIIHSHKMYERVRAFHQNIIGNNEESIQRYRSMYRTSSNEKKGYWGSLLVKSIVYRRMKKSGKDSRRAYSTLTNSERKEIETVLEHQMNQGDVKSFETLFLLKLYGPDEYSLDEAIDLLKEWENQFIDANTFGWGYLNVCFYLAVCYSAKSIQADVPNKELSELAKRYFRESEDLAKRFGKGTVYPLYYFGEKEDIHCIVDKNRKNSDACTVIGVIRDIKNNKGILEMKCGLEVSFNANKFDKIRDEGKALRGVLGFSYNGPGLYDFRPDSDNESSAVYYDMIDEKEITEEELEQSYVPIEDLVEEPKEEKSTADDSQYRQPNLKIVGKVDLPIERKTKTESSFGKKKKPRTVSGVFKKGLYGKSDMVIQDFTEMKQPVRSIREGETIIDGDKVEYLLCSEPNSNDPTKKFWFAEDVHLKE